MKIETTNDNNSNVKLFIVGSPRSGTSIAFFAAREVLRLPGEGESHVIPIFRRIQIQFEQYAANFSGRSGVLAQYFEADNFREYIQNYVREFYKKIFKGENFVDKTPGSESMRAVEFIFQVFPDAKILAMRRTGIEVVQSYKMKFKVPFHDACRAWLDCMESLERMAAACPSVLIVDQYDLTNSPTETANAIARYVGRLEKSADLAAYFIQKRVEQSSHHDWNRRLILADTLWTDEEKEQFKLICGPKMDYLGYPM